MMEMRTTDVRTAFQGKAARRRWQSRLNDPDRPVPVQLQPFVKQGTAAIGNVELENYLCHAFQQQPNTYRHAQEDHQHADLFCEQGEVDTGGGARSYAFHSN
jgi:hypothetical protein